MSTKNTELRPDEQPHVSRRVLRRRRAAALAEQTAALNSATEQRYQLTASLDLIAGRLGTSGGAA